MNSNPYLDIVSSLVGKPTSSSPTPAAPNVQAEPVSKNPYSDIVSKIPAQGAQAKINLLGAVEVNPNEYAEAKRLGEKLGLSAEVVQTNRTEINKRLSIEDFSTLRINTPKLAEAYEDPTFAKLAHDDKTALMNLAQQFKTPSALGDWRSPLPTLDVLFRNPQASVTEWKQPTPSVSSVAQGLATAFSEGWKRTKLGSKLMSSDLLSNFFPNWDPVGQEVSRQDLLRQAQVSRTKEMMYTPEFQTTVASGVYGGVQSLVSQLPSIALGLLTRSPTIGLSAMAAPMQPELYAKYAARKATATEALIGSVSETAVEIATEKTPMGFLIKNLGKTGALNFVKGWLIREGLSEQVATFAQDAIDTAIANPDKTWGEYLRERPGAAAETLIATITQASLLGGASAGLRASFRKLEERNIRAQNAQQEAMAREYLGSAVANTALHKRDPAVFEKLVTKIAPPNSTRFIDANTFAQSLTEAGIDPLEVASSINKSEELKTAIETNGDLEIPLEKYLAHIETSPAGKVLAQHVRDDPEGVSLAEAPKVLEMQKTELAEVTKQLTEEQMQKKAIEESTARVEDAVFSSLSVSGYTPDVNKKLATLTSLMFATQAQRLGVSPEELYKQYPLSISAKRVAVKDGTQFEQKKKKDKTKKGIEQPAPSEVNVPTQTDSAPKAMRGTITFKSNLSEGSVISLLQDADLSTYLHELGHFYLEILNDLAIKENAPQGIVKDMNTVLEWFNVADLASWNNMSIEDKRKSHEKFARGFEAYLFEGKSPTVELKGIFATIRSWMREVYKTLVNLKVKLSPEVRTVFDRMLATEAQIADTEAVRAHFKIFGDAQAAEMTEEEWAQYLDDNSQATQDAISELQSRSLKDFQLISNVKKAKIKKLSSQAKKLYAEIVKESTIEVRNQQVYVVKRFLANGEIPEKLKGTEFATTKMSLPLIKKMYKGSKVPSLPAGKKKGLVTGRKGLPPQVVAELFGYSSADHLIKDLVQAPPEAEVIEAMSDRKMLERYGDLVDAAAIEKAANKAVHNEARLKAIATGYKYATKAVGSVRQIVKAAKEIATDIISKKTIRSISPRQFEIAETKAGKAMLASIADPAAFAMNTKYQLLNTALAKEAHDALDYVEKQLKYLKKVTANKNIEPDTRSQIEAILDRYDIAKTKEQKRKQTLSDWVASKNGAGLQTVVPSDVLLENVRIPYYDLTLEDFRGLVDAVRNMEHLGKLHAEMLTAEKNEKFAHYVSQVTTTITDNAKRTLPVRLERNTTIDRIKDFGADYLALHRKFASIMREMDGFVDDGVLWNVFTRPMNNCGNTEAVMREKATIRLGELFSNLFKQGKTNTKIYIPEINNSLSREGMIMVALNAGTDSNLQRLMDGDKWTLEQITAIVNNLSKEDMDFVQSIWDMIDGYRTDIAAQQKRFTGVEPKWHEPLPLMTKYGEYKGGYFPVKYDTKRSIKALQDEAEANLMDMWRGGSDVKTRDSFVQARAEQVKNRPVRKDFGVIFQHITDVTHRLAWQDWLFDANRLLRSSPVVDAINTHYGPEVLKTLHNALEDIAAGEVGAESNFEAVCNYIRTGATIAGMGWRLTTALMQPFGLTNSVARIGTKYVAKGLKEWLGSPEKMTQVAESIYAKSDMMRLRSKTMQREINEIRNKITSGGNELLKASYFYLMGKMQVVVDIPTWLGEYHKSLEQNADEATAIARADQAVLDTQGGGQIKDLSAIQRGGPLQRLFTTFYSYFNTIWNLTVESTKKTNFKSPTEITFWATDMLMLYVIPASLSVLLKFGLSAGWDEPDWETKLAKQLLKDNASYMMGGLVGLRELADAPNVLSEGSANYQGPAGLRAIGATYTFLEQASQGELDWGFYKAAINAAGPICHLPSGQVTATLSGIIAMSKGQTDNPGVLIMGTKVED